MSGLSFVLWVLIANAILLSAYVLTSLSLKGWRKWGGPVVIVAVLAALAGSTFMSLGVPRPVTESPFLNMIVWGPIPAEDTYVVLAATFDEGVAIYAWLQPKSGGAPIYIVLPWSQEKAEALNSAMEQADAQGQQAEVDGGAMRGYNGFDIKGPTFQAPPPPSMPPKSGS